MNVPKSRPCGSLSRCRRLRPTLGAALVALLLPLMASGGASAALEPVADPVSPLGTNLNTFRDYSSEWAPADAFKQSRPWLTQCMDCRPLTVWDSGEQALLDLDEFGWVRSLPAPADSPTFTSVGTTMFTGIDGHYPGGRYTVLYDGRGTLAYGRDAVRIDSESVPGRDVVQVTPTDGGIWLRILATDPDRSGDYLRNIRVLPPGLETTTEMFHPLFLERAAKYRLLRFMQWMDVNGSTLAHWDDRPRMDDARWMNPGRGVPIEMTVALANRLHAEAWYSIPHQADDDFVQRFAELVRDTLAPGLKVWVEYSNEVWNGSFGFDQSRYALAQGRAMWPESPASDFQKQMNWYGLRSAQVCDIWKAAFGADSGRVACVVSGQAANSWVAQQALDCPLWTAGAPCSAHGVDAVAIAPYLDLFFNDQSNRDAILTWTQESDGGLVSAFDEIEHGGRLPRGYAGGSLAECARRTAAHRTVASARGLALVAYEAGNELHDPRGDARIDTLMRAVNRDDRMGAVSDRYLADWRAGGGDMLVHFVNVQRYNQHGNAGALEYLDQAGSPKHDSLMRFIDANPCWWPDCTIPAPAECGDGTLDDGEDCDPGPDRPGDCCTASCLLASAGTVCRDARDACDAEESCDGAGEACPVDEKVSAGTVCRDARDACDAAESCDGAGDACPVDAKVSAGTVCRDARDACDAAETCDGAGDACPVDEKVSAGTVCRDARDACDEAETCDGVGDACPEDVAVVDGTPCDDGTGCPLADTCRDGACADAPCVKADHCESGLAIADARLSLKASPMRLRLSGSVRIPEPWTAVDPLRNGLRLVVAGVVDADLPGGEHWNYDASGRRWLYRDRTGSAAGITQATVIDRRAVEPGLLEFRVSGTGPATTLPPPSSISAAVMLGDWNECGTSSWSEADCRGNASRVRCR